MLYPFMTLVDNTEIVHSESYTENGMAFGVNKSTVHAENNIKWFRSEVVWVVE